MTYSRMLQPRFYMDNPNWLVSRGLARSTIFSNNTGAGFDTFNTGYNVYQLFDGDPLNLCSFDTSTGTDTVSIKIDYTVVAMPTDFVCIMNHNLATAAGKIRVAHSNSPITTVGGGTAVTFTEIFNGDVSGEFATPDNDYDTLLTFTSSDDRYWVIEFYDISTWSATDLTIGNIILGEHYTMPSSPDLQVTQGPSFEGVNVSSSVGGRSFGTASWIMANGGTYTPFRAGTYFRKIAGRQSYDFAYGYVDDTNIRPSNMRSPASGANYLHDVVNKSGGELLRFIFTPDSTSTTEGDYLWARFDQPDFRTTRQAWGVETFRTRIVQEF